MAQTSLLVTPYIPGPSPQGDASTTLYNQNQFRAISTAFGQLWLMTPQPATKAPVSPQDGMIRLSRSPWRPLSGQTADQWVYYDAPSSSWKLLSAN